MSTEFEFNKMKSYEYNSVMTAQQSEYINTIKLYP